MATANGPNPSPPGRVLWATAVASAWEPIEMLTGPILSQIMSDATVIATAEMIMDGKPAATQSWSRFGECAAYEN